MKLNQLIEVAIQAAILAGEKIMEVYTSGDFGIAQKNDHSPLTEADLQAHQVILNLLHPTHLPVLSEEGIPLNFQDRQHWKTFWLVDPLDGTREFIQRNDEFTVNIALIHENQCLAGVVYCPVTKELYVGIVDSGAWKIMNPNAQITLEAVSTQGLKLPFAGLKNEFTVAVSRSNLDEKTMIMIDELKVLHPDLKIIRKGSSLKFCLLAEGTAHIYPRFGPTMEWDTAAGHAIVKAVGKNIYLTDQQTEIKYNKENLMNPYFIAL